MVGLGDLLGLSLAEWTIISCVGAGIHRFLVALEQSALLRSGSTPLNPPLGKGGGQERSATRKPTLL